MSVGIGEMVIYVLSLGDVEEINAARVDIPHINYSPVMNGDLVAAAVTRENPNGTVNLRLLLDGEDSKWLQFREYSRSGMEGYYTDVPKWKKM